MAILLSPEYIIAFVLGTILGSFANVCIHWLPCRQSLVFPGLYYLQCQQGLRPWHKIPLLSYVWLGRRCAYCQRPIAWRYLLVEFLGGVLYVFLYHQFGFSVQSVVLTLLVTVLLIVSGIDLAHQIVPDAITLPGMLIGVGTSALLTPVGLSNALLGLCLGGSLFLLIAVLSRGGMGGGDIKLIAMIGAFLGWQAVLVTIFMAAMLSAVVGLSLILLKQKSRKDPIPFAPFLALGAFVAMLWGSDLMLA